MKILQLIILYNEDRGENNVLGKAHHFWFHVCHTKWVFTSQHSTDAADLQINTNVKINKGFSSF